MPLSASSPSRSSLGRSSGRLRKTARKTRPLRNGSASAGAPASGGDPRRLASALRDAGPGVELCLPKLLRLARCCASGDCGRSARVLARGASNRILLLQRRWCWFWTRPSSALRVAIFAVQLEKARPLLGHSGTLAYVPQRPLSATSCPTRRVLRANALPASTWRVGPAPCPAATWSPAEGPGMARASQRPQTRP